MARDRKGEDGRVRTYVERFATESLNNIDLLLSMSESRGDSLETLLHLLLADKGRYSNKAALDEAARVLDSGFSDLRFAVIFLSCWSSLCAHMGRFGEASALANRAEAFVSEDMAPEFRAQILHLRGVLAGRRGDKTARERASREILLLLGKQSPRYHMYLLDHALFVSWQGRWIEVEEDLRAIGEAWSGTPQSSYPGVVRFVGLVETGCADEAHRLLQQLPEETVSGHMFQRIIARAQTELDLLRGVLRPELLSGGSGFRLWAESAQRLFDGRPKDALDLARAHMNEQQDLAHLGVGFGSLTLIRAELANGNAEAAMRLLGQRWIGGYRNYLDDFFLARAELLRGHRDSAVRYLQSVTEAAERYRATGRLDFESRLAVEISPAVLVRLLPLAAKPAAPEPMERMFPVARSAPSGADRLIGGSSAMMAVRAIIERCAPTDAPVLITGETGTGKELVARAIHETGPRAQEPFVAVNCAAVSESLIESELFGHERGAFSGAVAARKGFFEEAGRGTVLLDEIGDISARLQAALLRVLETGEIRRVGSSSSRKVTCRLVTATNASLDRMVVAGTFRKDLMFRLRRLEVFIQPLREHAEDIVPLAAHFLAEGRTDERQPTISPEAAAVLRRYAWPGNVRELRNEAERLRLMNSEKLAYDLADLHPRIRGETPESAAEAMAGPPAVPAPQSSLGPSAGEGFRIGRSAMRQLDELRQLFRQKEKLTRVEVYLNLGVSTGTATRYLRLLMTEGLIEKVMPNASPRTHYFRLRG